MDFTTFDGLLRLVQEHGYWFIFIIMLIEGPTVTAVAGFAAAIGKLSYPIVLVLAFFGDFISDILYYWIGYLGRGGVLERYGHRFGVTSDRLSRMERYLNQNAVKGLVIAKWLPVVPIIALVAAGALRMKFFKFLTITTLIIIPRVILFSALGFYSGRAFMVINQYMQNATWAILLFLAVGTIIFVAYRVLSRHLASHLHEEDSDLVS